MSPGSDDEEEASAFDPEQAAELLLFSGAADLDLDQISGSAQAALQNDQEEAVPSSSSGPLLRGARWAKRGPSTAEEYSSAAGLSSSAATQSPSELPVPTERPVATVSSNWSLQRRL